MNQKAPKGERAPIELPTKADGAESAKIRSGKGLGFTGFRSSTYVLGSDFGEKNRLNAQHYQFRFLLEGDYHAPVTQDLNRGIQVLDVGCGTGIWAVEMAKQFPKSHFTATDIADVFATTTSPSNCSFMIADTTKGLPFADNTFDFVFQRAAVLCFPEEKWPKVLKELVRVTKPGGYVELIDCDVFLYSAGPFMSNCYEQIVQAMKMRGVNVRYITSMGPELTLAGLENLNHDYVSAPMGWGPANIANLLKEDFLMQRKGLKAKLTLALGIDNSTYDHFTDIAIQELGDRYRPYFNIEMYIGQKPGKK